MHVQDNARLCGTAMTILSKVGAHKMCPDTGGVLGSSLQHLHMLHLLLTCGPFILRTIFMMVVLFMLVKIMVILSQKGH